MTTPKPDTVDGYIDAYVAYLDGEASRPEIDGLTGDDRREARELAEMMEAGRGLDPKSIAGTKAYARAHAADDRGDNSHGPVIGALAPTGPAARAAAHLRSFAFEVEPDAAALSVPVVASDLVLSLEGAKLRVRVIGDTNIDTLYDPTTLDLARMVLARFEDTIALAVVLDDEGHTSLVLDTFDVHAAIEVPTGSEAGPRPRRQPLPLGLALGSYREELAPQWDELPAMSGGHFDDFSIQDASESAASRAVDATVAEGRRAHEPRKSAWTSLEGTPVAGGLSDVVVAVYEQRNSADEIRDQLERLGGDAA